VVIYPRYITPLKCFILKSWVDIAPSNRMIHILVTFAYLIRLRTQGDVIFKYFNNIVASKKDQSTLNKFFLHLSHDIEFLVVDFEMF
jgi:hypothetical protein